jgi:hypothetical protein
MRFRFILAWADKPSEFDARRGQQRWRCRHTKETMRNENREDRFVGTPDDRVVCAPGESFPRNRGIVIDMDGDGVVTATVCDGQWIAGDPSLVGVLKARQQYTRFSSDGSLASDALAYLGLPDDRYKPL